MKKIGKVFCPFEYDSNYYRYLYLFFLFVMTSLHFCVARAEVSIQASVPGISSSKEVALGRPFRWVLSITTTENEEVQDLEGIEIPKSSGFHVEGTSKNMSQGSKMFSGPGGFKVESYKILEVALTCIPERLGRITLPALDIKAGGKLYKSQPIELTVVDKKSLPVNEDEEVDPMDEAEQLFQQLLQRRGLGGGPKFPPRGGGGSGFGGSGPGGSGSGGSDEPLPAPSIPSHHLKESFFLVADVDKKEVYEGEQITVNWFLYTQGNILKLDRLKFPDLKGFWKEPIEEVSNLIFNHEIVNGQAFQRALLGSYALFPIKTGEAIVDEYKIKAAVQLPSQRNFGGFSLGMGPTYNFSKSSDRIKIKVKPLPVQGRPSDFTGAVGNFQVRSLLEGQEFPVNQPFTLKIRFDGQGNAKLIELPGVSFSDKLEVFDKKSDSKFFKNGTSFKEYEILLIPRAEGDLEIPPMKFSLFNPETGAYYTQETSGHKIKIIPSKDGKGGGGAFSESRLNNEKEDGLLLNGKKDRKSIAPELITIYDLGIRDRSIISVINVLYPWGWVAIYSLILLILLWKAQMEFGWGRRKKDLKQILKNKWAKMEVHQKEGNWRTVGTEAVNLIYFVLGSLSGQGGANLELHKLLDRSSPTLRRTLGNEIYKLVDEFQMLSFAPEELLGKRKEPAEVQAKLDQMKALLIKVIDTESAGVKE